MNTYQALRTLNVKQGSSQDEIKAAYRRLALEMHPDRSGGQTNGEEFKKIAEAYGHLRRKGGAKSQDRRRHADPTKRPQWGAPKDGKVPEQDWGKYTGGFEGADPDLWKEYERRFWDEYNARAGTGGDSGESGMSEEPGGQPDPATSVDESLCIGCCSCEIIAPEVFQINREAKSNPKSSVINQRGAGVDKIISAARTCPTKAITVDDAATGERLFPY